MELGGAAFLACPASLELLEVRDRLLHISGAHPMAAVRDGVAGLVRRQCGRHGSRRYRCFTRVAGSASASPLAQVSAAEFVYTKNGQRASDSLYVTQQTISTWPTGFGPAPSSNPLAPHMLRARSVEIPACTLHVAIAMPSTKS